ncbi:MAG: hypothetical protein L6406_15880 [Desulfobacterales bacterium]|nr:hypothetical protein [Nanoarchaeota archaeon]MCG2777149.1 hypothetical protein [Desulfobacterales bacterium]
MKNYGLKIIQKGMKRLMVENRGLFRELKWMRPCQLINGTQPLVPLFMDAPGNRYSDHSLLKGLWHVSCVTYEKIAQVDASILIFFALKILPGLYERSAKL